MAKKSTTKGADTTGVEKEEILVLPLISVHADFAWNSRQGDWRSEEGDDEQHNFKMLKSAIATRGQDTPVDVRMGKNGKYELITGFRRYAAIQESAKEKGDKNPTIRCILRDEDILAARTRNVRENTERDGLRGPDLAHAVKEIHDGYSAKGVVLTGQALGDLCGISQEYAARCLTIMKGIKDASILKDWRNGVVQVGMHEMVKVSKVDRQREAFDEIVTSKSNKTVKGGPDRWKDSAKEYAEKVGATLAEYEFLGWVDVNAGAVFDTNNARKLGAVGNDEKRVVSAELAKEIVSNAKDTYKETKRKLENPEPPKEKKGKKADGAQASAN